MYQLTQFGNSVVRLVDTITIPFAEGNSDYQRYLLWLAEGNTPLPYVPYVPPPSVEGSKVAIQQALDARARERGYDGIHTACVYASPEPLVPVDSPEFDICERFRAEGNALRVWMVLTWATAFAYIANPDNPIPSAAESVAMMPPFQWPVEDAEAPPPTNPPIP